MKIRFSTYDLLCSITELQRYVGLRVNQIYDVDHKTYLIRLQKTEEKVIILLESGNRIHTTNFEWPKNVAPSSFSMKLRKHLKNKRLESLKQLGIDRIGDLQFGSGEAAYHVILELYDKGNIVLTDWEYTILNILRPYTATDKFRFAVREKYPIDRARDDEGTISDDTLRKIFSTTLPADNYKKILNPNLAYGPAVIDHILLGAGIKGNAKIGDNFDIEQFLPKIKSAIAEAEELVKEATTAPSKGYIIQKIEKRPKAEGGVEDLVTNQEFHPRLFRQHEGTTYKEFESFDQAVDEFFSSVEGQKIDMKALQQEKEAMKKLENVRKDHDQRLEQLSKSQEKDRYIAELITTNQELIDKAILAIRTAIANQLSWPDIQTLVKEAAARGDEVASYIKHLKLDKNHITMELCEQPDDENSDSEEYDSDEDQIVKKDKQTVKHLVDIDLDLTAFANARRYYDQKRTAAKKQQKTIESQSKAFKSAEKRTKQTLKEMQAIVNINKARKVYWFEKFFWFISSENYLVIGGRDMIQNELIVKRYMRQGDLYVHADIHGASSVVIKNPTGEVVPPKTLNEAGTMAICYSVAWEAKVVTKAWWVHSDQVSKTAPAGEYLTAGSFMVRGKKNYLPPCQLVLGFSFLFKLEEGSVARHSEERKVRSLEDDVSEVSLEDNDVEVQLSDDDELEVEQQDAGQDEAKLEQIEEEEEAGDGEEEGQESKSEESDESEEEEKDVELTFPDTEIKIRHEGKQVSLEARTSVTTNLSDEENDDDVQVVYLGDDKPVVVRKNTKPANKNTNKEKHSAPPRTDVPKPATNNNSKPASNDNKLKRGQKYKLKKIKEKYKDQDEEERRLCMEILHSGKGKEKKSKKRKGKDKNQTEKKVPVQKIKPAVTKTERGSGGEEDDDPEPEPAVNTDVDVLNTLTGQPHVEDELLFAVPVVAPYNTLHNYKFKVKLTPGTGKRGKAAKTALSMFVKDKACTQREKELFKGVKDEMMARNLPGKVKLSAPQLYKK